MIPRLALAAAVALASAPAFATTYTLDPGHTQVVVQWAHFGYSHPTAQFGKIEGTLDYDEAAPTKARVDATITLSSINSNVPDLDTHLQTADFFDASQYPVAKFHSTKVETGASAGKLKVTGDLTLHGVTKPVVLDVSLNKVGEHPMWKAPVAGFDASTSIQRSDFGITKYVPMVSDTIDIRITTEAIESKAYAASLKKK